MSFFSGLFKSRDKPQNKTAGSSYTFYMGGTTSGKSVTERSAMQMTAVYSCVRILAEAVAGLPLHLYRYNQDGGKEKAIDHPLYRLLHDEPNMTDIQKQQITAMRLQGAGYVTIGKKLGLSNNTVRSFCRRNGLDGDAGKNAVMCKQCSKPIKITPKRKPKIFCSDACRTAWWNSHPEEVNRKAIYRFTCVCCGEPFTAYGNRNRKYCSRDCYFTNRFRKEQDFHE